MNNQEKVWKVGMWVGILLIVFLAIISIKELRSISYVGADVPIKNTITVSGKGEAVTIPDIATFSFSVSEVAKEVAVAQEAAKKKSDAAIQAMKDNGVEERDIKTTSYNINPNYDYTQRICNTFSCPPSTPVLTGYTVSQTVSVKVRDTKKAGTLLQAIGTLGVQNVDSLQFSIDDIDGVKADARKMAIEDAKEKAQILAKDLGVKIVRIISFEDQTYDPIFPYAARDGAELSAVKNQASSPPNIPAGEQKVTANVVITYEIR